MLKILHIADVHLDSPFSRLDARRAAIRQEELRATFSDTLRYARENGVRLILLAGDVFDGAFVTKETVAFLFREFSLFPGPIVIAPGNHDPLTPDSVWAKTDLPENVYLFRSGDLSCFSFDALGVDVYGYAFTSPERTDPPLAGARPEETGRIPLLCIHGDLGVPLSRYAPITRREILDFGAAYTALGHVHNPGEIEMENGIAYGYAGCLEGRGPDETGPKGAVLVEIETADGENTVTARRIRFSRRRYEEADVDVTGADTLTAIEEKILSAVKANGFGEDTLLRINLTGAVAPALVVDTRSLSGRFPQLFSVEIRDRTVPLLDTREYENDRTVRGAFYRAMAEKIENGSPREKAVAVRALRYGLSAIAGENISDL